LSYTSFAFTSELTCVREDEIELRVTVQNVGDRPGKEVVQVYGEVPQGVLGKPVRQLAVRSARLTGSYFQNFKVIERLQAACVPQETFQHMKPEQESSDGKYHIYYETVPAGGPTAASPNAEAAEIAYTGDQGHRLVDVLDGKVPMDTFLAQISDEDLICMFRGEGMCSPLVTPGTASAFGGVTESLRELGIPAACCADGPSGIRMDCGMRAFSLPNGTALGVPSMRPWLNICLSVSVKSFV